MENDAQDAPSLPRDTAGPEPVFLGSGSSKLHSAFLSVVIPELESAWCCLIPLLICTSKDQEGAVHLKGRP